MRNSVCKTCGSEREVLYELDWAPVYFCETCETTAHGSLKGIIGTVPKGSNGFGYDPVFHLNERGCTTAELSPYEKHKLSHRGQAANKILAILNRGLLTK